MGQALSVNGRVLSFGNTVINLTCIDPADITISPTVISNVTNVGTTCSVSLCGHVCNKTTVVAIPSYWITVSSPQYPAPTPGTTTNLVIAQNTGGARSATIQFIPNVGTTKCVTVSQLAANPIYLSSINGYESQWYSYCLSKLCGVCVPSTSTCVCVGYDLNADVYGSARMCIICNNTIILGCTIYNDYSYGDFSFTVDSDDNVCFCTNVDVGDYNQYADSSLYINSITQISGSYMLGSPNYQYSYVYS